MWSLGTQAAVSKPGYQCEGRTTQPKQFHCCASETSGNAKG